MRAALVLALALSLAGCDWLAEDDELVDLSGRKLLYDKKRRAYVVVQNGKRVPHSYLEPTVIDETKYYTVAGHTPADFWVHVRSKGPKDYQGKIFAGMTQAIVQWQWYAAPEWSGCRVAAADAVVRVTITMPQWEAGTSPSPGIDWAGYVRALQEHENGHREIGIDEGREVKSALLDLPKMEDCETLQEAAVAVAARIHQRRVERNRHYDAITMHGATQGASMR